MERVKDFTPFQWIVEETESIDFDHWNGSRVENFLPTRFTHYAKLMHPLHPDKNIKDKSILWSECDPDEEVTFNFGERILMKDLAREYGITFTREFSFHTIANLLGGYPRYLPGPAEDTIDEEMVPEVVELLKPFTTRPCFFQYDLAKVRWYEENHGFGYLYRGDLTDISQFAGYDEVQDYPNYWYPEDKSWCLFSGLDFNFSLFGGNKEMMEAFAANSVIECIEVDKSTRVDHQADVKNSL